ncbi:MAG: STAS domain-containing protein [Alphaproteobacteria bacterium]|nr:STAS domain-containing protein [Alphaproteobacteria bacterium]
MPANAKIEIAQRDGVIVASIEGDIDLHVSGDVRERLLTLVNDHPVVVVDLSKVSGIDSSGVASLLEAFQRATKRARTLILAEAGAPVMRVLRMARLDTVFKPVPTVDDALKSLADRR